jgi:hypothetical protein
LLTDVCKGQHLFDYKKDSLATSFNVIRFAILAEEELAHSIYYIDAYWGIFSTKMNMEPEKIFLAEQGIYPKKR